VTIEQLHTAVDDAKSYVRPFLNLINQIGNGFSDEIEFVAFVGASEDLVEGEVLESVEVLEIFHGLWKRSQVNMKEKGEER
jgi:hypothetical protein